MIANGTKFGRYEIRSLIGAGGMGEVYLAEDSRLRRKIALKVLPENIAQDKDRLRRFEQEAFAASALNHPNILTIYEFGAENEIHFLAAEYVEGETLRERLQREPFSIDEALDVAVQTVSALAAAHEAGIIHRDVKPENIIIRRDRLVKILDFGLAKLTENESEISDAEAETRAQVKTAPGVIMGTAGYMSPEQARGKESDARTDLWSLGCVLYEMIAGCAAFNGETVADLIADIVKSSPAPLSQFAEDVPERLEEIVAKTLEKNADERYQTAKDLLIDLRRLKRKLDFESEMERSIAPSSQDKKSPQKTGDERKTLIAAANTTENTETIKQATSSAEYIATGFKRHKTGSFLILSLLAMAVLAAAFGTYKFLKRDESRPTNSSQAMKVTRLTSTGKVTRAAASPDGKYAVHVVEDAGKQGLWIRQIATASNVNVLPPTEATYLGLTFSQDGNYVYFVRRERAGGKGIVYQMDTLGGSLKKIIEGADGAITLSPDGKRFAFIRQDYSKGEGALVIANIDGSGERNLATPKEPEGFEPEGLAWSPDGKVIACSYYSAGGDDAVGLVEVAVEDGTVKQILSQKWGSIRSVAWLGDGSGLLMSGADKSSGYFYQIWHVAYPKGESRRITNDLNTYSDVSVTADSNTLLTVQGDTLSNLWIAPNGDAGRAQRITSGKYDGGMGVAWTPDGRIIHASRDWDIWIMDADGSNQKLLTVDEHNNRWVSVTPDGRYILFESWRKSITGESIWRMDIDGGNPKPLTEKGWASVPRASPDGKWVVYESSASGKMTLWKMTIDGDEEKQLTDKNTEEPAISPDGKLIACFYYPEGQSIKLAVIPFDGGDTVYEFDVDQSIRDKTPGWTADGRAITYILNRGGVSNIWSQPLDGGAPKQLTGFKTDRIFAFEWSRDGKQLALSRGAISNDVVMISNFK